MFQYPLRPNNRFYGDQGQLSNVTLNKNNPGNVKIEYSIESKNQKNVDYQVNDTKMHNQILNGQRIGLNTNYCIGSFKDNALHLNPVSHVLQFRPEFGVLDETNQNRKNRERGKEKYSKTAEVTESVNKAQDEWINLEYINENGKIIFNIRNEKLPFKGKIVF